PQGAGYSADPSILQALIDEFEIAVGMRHPHIININDFGFFHGIPYFTMEYLEDAQLIDVATEDTTESHKIGLLIQTLQAIEYLHRRGILHRDLKPENILVVNGRQSLRLWSFCPKKESCDSKSHWQSPLYES
ncbi:MAG: protein kinase, partial [Anaerolineae bacterium]|nr:protein kinase [Anaerolineae bacterium]